MGFKFNPFTANFDLVNPPGATSWGDISGNIDDQTDLINTFSDYINRSGSYYFTSNASDTGGGRLEMITTIPPGGGFGISNTGVTNGTTLAEFCSVLNFPNTEFISSGVMSFVVQARKDSGTKTAKLYAEFYRRDTGGTNYLLATTDLSASLISTNTEVHGEVAVGVLTGIGLTDRLLVRIIADVSGAGTDPDISIDIQGNTHSRASTPILFYNSSVVLAWGSITGTLSDQTDLQNALDTKRDIFLSKLVEPDNGGFNSLNYKNINIEPLQDSPDEIYSLDGNYFNFDPTSTGFNLGTNGVALKFKSNSVDHFGTGNLGSINFTENTFNIGNGTDPIEFKGFGYSFGFGTINDKVNLVGPLQGYGFQPNMDALATFDSGSYVNAFYDFANFNCSINNYTSFSAGPTIENINTTNSYVGMNLNPTINNFTGDSGAVGIGLYGTYGDLGTYGYSGINLNPTISSAGYAVGLNVTMDNVTPAPGNESELTVQDLTYTFISVGNNNYHTMAYTSGATAGSEVVSILGSDITIQIEDGVSTATQIKTAIDATGLVTIINTTISGVGGNAQTIFSATNFINGTNPGFILAAYLDGDVEITGNLNFGGTLSFGNLNGFYQTTVIDGGGNPNLVNNLVTGLLMPASTTTANVDTIGANTTMLLTIDANSVNTSGPFKLGAAVLSLPVVVETHTGSSLDFINMGLYALNLAGSSTGGTIDRVNGARVEAIPNGITTVNEFVAYEFDQIFGQVGTDVWGFHIVPAYAENFLGGSLKIGGSDKVSNSSVAFEIESTSKALVLSRMDTTSRDAMTPIAGMQIYNTTTNTIQYYNGTIWV